MICNCPLGASLSAIPLSDCPESLGQVQKIIFQRVFKTGSERNSFTIATSDPKLKASWTPLLAASDGTKVVQSPFIAAPANEGGEARTYGGNNETLNGVTLILGETPTKFTCNILTNAQKTIKALKSYRCENLGIYMVDSKGRIWGLVDDVTTPTKFLPIPITAFFVSSKKMGGLETPDMNMMSWEFLPDWSDNLASMTPTDFNALSDLISA